MAYRALITIQSLAPVTGEVENECHATMNLGETWEEGEAMAHCLSQERNYPNACWLADGGFPQLAFRGCEWEGVTDYRDNKADQEWTVTFQRSGTTDDITITITGRNAVRDMIFFRKRVYGL